MPRQRCLLQFISVYPVSYVQKQCYLLKTTQHAGHLFTYVCVPSQGLAPPACLFLGRVSCASRCSLHVEKPRRPLLLQALGDASTALACLLELEPLDFESQQALLQNMPFSATRAFLLLRMTANALLV